MAYTREKPRLTRPVEELRRISRSAPQANEPPDLVLGAMKWLPKPSLRTAVGLGAAAAVFMATRPRRGNGQRTAAGT